MCAASPSTSRLSTSPSSSKSKPGTFSMPLGKFQNTTRTLVDGGNGWLTHWLVRHNSNCHRQAQMSPLRRLLPISKRSWPQAFALRRKSTALDRLCNSTKMLRLATTSSPRRLVSGKHTNWVSYSNSLLPCPKHAVMVSSPPNVHYKENFSIEYTPQQFLPHQTQTNNPPRPQHPPLPHGASKHGAPPPPHPLPPHRPHRRRLLHRLPLLRHHRRTNLLHKLPIRLRQL